MSTRIASLLSRFLFARFLLATTLLLICAAAALRFDVKRPDSERQPAANKLVVERQPAVSKPIVLAFGGDVHFEGVIRQRLATDPDTALGPVGAVLRRADLAVVNLETAVTARGRPAPKAFTFRAPRTAFRALRAAGVDVVTMANNHGMDFGETGLRDSLEAAGVARFPVVGIGLNEAGAFRPFTTTIKEQRVAIIGATQVLDSHLVTAWTAGPKRPGLASAKNERRLLAEVRAARSAANIVVIYLHWGKERLSCPTPVQQALARKLVAAGADVVVGSHAHVLLGGGYLDGAYVHYGLGNFVFYSSGFGPNTWSGVLILTMRGRSVTDANWSPAQIEDGVPVPLRGQSATAARARWKALRGCTGLNGIPRRSRLSDPGRLASRH